MRNVDGNFMKLFMFATHLQQEEVKKLYSKNEFLHFVHHGIILFGEGDGVHYNFLYPFLIKELPKLFHEWTYSQGSIIYAPEPSLLSAYAFCEFTGLEVEEFIEIFVPKPDTSNSKDSPTPYAGPEEIAERIYSFLEIVLLQRQNQITN